MTFQLFPLAMLLFPVLFCFVLSCRVLEILVRQGFFIIVKGRNELPSSSTQTYHHQVFIKNDVVVMQDDQWHSPCLYVRLLSVGYQETACGVICFNVFDVSGVGYILVYVCVLLVNAGKNMFRSSFMDRTTLTLLMFWSCETVSPKLMKSQNTLDPADVHKQYTLLSRILEKWI